MFGRMFPKTLADTLLLVNLAPGSELSSRDKLKVKACLIGITAGLAALKMWDAYKLYSHEAKKDQVAKYIQKK
jgi:hypothetical protein